MMQYIANGILYSMNSSSQKEQKLEDSSEDHPRPHPWLQEFPGGPRFNSWLEN